MAQVHLPLWQVDPVPQVVPQPPQLWMSVWVSAQLLPQAIWPELQVGPVLPPPVVAGVAQLATNSAEPKRDTKAKREAWRASIVLTPYGDRELSEPRKVSRTAASTRPMG